MTYYLAEGVEATGSCVEIDAILLKRLLEKGPRCCFLPPYSLEPNWIEMLWKKMKYEWPPFQSFTPQELEQAIDQIGAGFGSECQLTFC